MKRFTSKKGITLLAVMVVAVVSAVGAYAYWTTSGTGSGSAANAATNGNIVLTASWAADSLYPGRLRGRFGHGQQRRRFGSVTWATVILGRLDEREWACLASDFTVRPVVR